jgi:enoyl-CoA hydratase
MTDDYTDLLYVADRDRRIATVTLNRPRYRNALSRRLMAEISRAFEVAAEDDAITAIVLKGTGETFCAGHDLGSPEVAAERAANPWPADPPARFKRAFREVEQLLRLRDIPKPTIAAVQGHCIFAGWMLASAMDVVIAADDAKFLATHFQYFAVPWDLGVRNAKGLLYENRFLDAAEARELGLVYRVVPRDELDAAVDAYAARVAENDPFQLRSMKMAINAVQDQAGFRTHMAASLAQMMLGTGQSRNGAARRQHPAVARARKANEG